MTKIYIKKKSLLGYNTIFIFKIISTIIMFSTNTQSLLVIIIIIKIVHKIDNAPSTLYTNSYRFVPIIRKLCIKLLNQLKIKYKKGIYKYKRQKKAKRHL